MSFDPISYDKAEKARKHSKNVQEQLNQVKSDFIQHKLDYTTQFNEGFPSQAKDLKNNKTYTIKLQLSSEGNPQLISKEVI